MATENSPAYLPYKKIPSRQPRQPTRLLWVENLFTQYKSKIKYIQLTMLLFFLFLVLAPLFAKIPTFNDTILTSIVLLSQFLFWGVWYSTCLFSVIPFSRLWCGVLCPLGALSEWVGKIGLKRYTPKWVRWDGWLIVMFMSMTILGQTLDVRDDPAGLARMFAYIFILAITIGFIYGKNSSRPWCRYYCPIGKILGVVSRLGMIDFRPNSRAVPLPQKKSYYVEGRLCPTDYNLPYKVSTNNCITCGACAYGKKRAGLGIYCRNPGEEVLDILNREPNWAEVLFILLSPGLSAGGFLWLILHQYQRLRDLVGGWFLNQNDMWIFKHAPLLISSQRWNQHYSWLDVCMITGYMVTYSIIIGLISSVLIAMAARLVRTKKVPFKKTFISLTYQYTPVAILSIIIGLFGKFFQVMNHDFGVPFLIGISVKFSMLGISMLWTLYLTWQSIKKIHPSGKPTIRLLVAYSMICINIMIIFYMWWPVIFDYSYMSQVEQIRQHIVVPS